jgi:hypothetical protein
LGDAPPSFGEAVNMTS